MAPGKRRNIIGVKVSDIEKRRYPSKHYVYIIQVTWDDQSDTVIFRRYSKFFDFQIALLESFPKEGGLRDPSERIIPFLPGKILFGRSHVKEVALKRKGLIDEYCNALIQLPPHISNSEHVLDFFESKPEDLKPNKEELNKKKKKDDQDISEISAPILLEQYQVIADFTKTQAKELTIVAGQHVEVIEKHENGWWFVNDEEGERGWVPGVYLETRDGQIENLVTEQAELGQGERYITTSKFTGGSDDEVSFGSGVLVEVLQKNLEGWWYICYQGKEGWAPASYLEKPADAVLRQNRQLSSVAKTAVQHRRSFPGDGNEIATPDSNSLSVSTPIKSLENNLKLIKRNSNPSMVTDFKSSISHHVSSQPRPPPKRSSLKRSSVALKPQKPPPLPPGPKISSEPVYEYFTTALFSGNVPGAISFKEDQKVKVLEKSPGDWWLIELDGKEGWAPASHVKRVYRHENPPKAPQRPRPPSASNKPVLSKTASAQQQVVSPRNEDSSPRPQQPRPPLLPPNQSNKKTSQPIKPAPPKYSAKPFSESTNPVANNFQNLVKNGPGPNQNPSNPPKPPAKPAAKPLPVSNKSKLITSATFESSRNEVKKPSPLTNYSKPAAAGRKIRTSDPDEESKTNQHDFRSVLKPTSNNLFSKKSDASNKPRPPVAGKPMLPNKPSNKSALAKSCLTSNSKTPVTKAGVSAPPKPPISSSKPVLRRIQNYNSNNNNQKFKKMLDPEIVVNRVDIECTAPSILALNRHRGSPDGQDDISVEKCDFHDISSKSDIASESEFVAISNFTSENPLELAFSTGEVARLIKKSEDDWWFVEIKDRSGWAPSSCFAQKSKKFDDVIDCNASDSLNSNSLSSSRSDATTYDDCIYSEIADITERSDDELYRVVQSYSSCEQSTIGVEEGDLVRVLDRSSTGWSFVRITESKTELSDREGWVPSDHLQPFCSLT